jgi:hypothetical protein
MAKLKRDTSSKIVYTLNGVELKSDTEIEFTLNEAGAHVIKAAQTKHGPRMSWGIDEYVQGVIAIRFPDGLPKIDPNFSHLTRIVNKVLATDHQFQTAFGKNKVERRTVRRAFQALRSANP